MYFIQEKVQIGPLTTFELQAVADRLITYDDPHADLPALHAEGLLVGAFPLGGGSNVAFVADFPGTVIKAVGNHPVEFCAEGEVRAYAGTAMDFVVAETVNRNLWGLENLSGIPGTVGGAAVQNVGAYGAELKDTAVSVEVFDIREGCFRTFKASDCHYGYRWSMFKEPDNIGRYIVVAVTFRLSEQSHPNLGYGALKATVEEIGRGAEVSPRIVRRAVIRLRDSKLPNPAVIGSAGSFFKNPVVSREQFADVERRCRREWGRDIEVVHYDLPDGRVKLSAAWLIDRCNWKGRRVGGVAVWEKQPLVLVNHTGEATGRDLVEMKDSIIRSIESITGVSLHPEAILLPGNE